MSIEEFPIIGFYLYHVTSAGQSSNWTTSGILTIELLYIGYNFKEIKKRQLIIEESDKTACHFGHLWLHLYTVFILCWPKLHPVLSSKSARGPFENNKILRTCL